MRLSRKLLGIVLASVLCGVVLGVISAPAAHAQSGPPQPGAGCNWKRVALVTKSFSYGGKSGYSLQTYLWADYSNTFPYLTCHHMFAYALLATPANAEGKTLWVYLNDCTGATQLSASTLVNHGSGTTYTDVYTGSRYQDCGQGEAVDVATNGIWMVDVVTPYTHV
jgi:hypothetical protein